MRAWDYLRREVLPLPSRWAVALFFVGLLVFPLFNDDPFVLRIIIVSAIFAIFAASWDLLSGFTGQINFGHALFFGAAAYSSALLNKLLGWSIYLTIPTGALVATLVGLLVGIPCLRLRGSYLSLTTLAFPLMLTGVLFMFPSFTGGEMGLSGFERFARSRLINYYIIVPTMLVLVFAMWRVANSRVGLIFHAIREDEIAARAAGINTVYYKLLAFCLSGFFAGLSGGLYAHFLRATGPDTLSVFTSFQPVIWTIFGGVATIYGPVAGVFILFPALELLRAVPEFRMLLFGVLVLLTLRFMPRGLIPWLRALVERPCPRCKRLNFVAARACRVCGAPLRGTDPNAAKVKS